jgi:carbon monoxide dehydrogenase subunit G
MRFEEQIRVPVGVPAVWDFLWQIDRVAACLPGCQSVREIAPGQAYQARFEDAIGPYRASFDLDVTVQEKRPPELIRLTASGQDKRLGTSQQVTMAVSLRPDGPAASVLDVTADVVILGKVATLGQFAIKRKARDVVQRFTRNLAAALESPSGEATNA